MKLIKDSVSDSTPFDAAAEIDVSDLVDVVGGTTEHAGTVGCCSGLTTDPGVCSLFCGGGGTCDLGCTNLGCLGCGAS